MALTPSLAKKPQYVLKDKGGFLWVGTNEGLLKIDRNDKSSTLFNIKNSQLADDDILVISRRKAGKVNARHSRRLEYF